MISKYGSLYSNQDFFSRLSRITEQRNGELLLLCDTPRRVNILRQGNIMPGATPEDEHSY